MKGLLAETTTVVLRIIDGAVYLTGWGWVALLAMALLMGFCAS